MGFVAIITPEWSWLNVLAFLCASFWTYTYVAVIRQNFKCKTCVMPVEALMFNFSWEVIFGAVWLYLQRGQNPQAWVNILWALFDVAIIYSFFRFASTRGVSNLGFKKYGAAVLVFGFAIQGAAFWNDYPHIENLHAVSAWLVNAIMSLAFIRMLWVRGPTGQTMGIAWGKALGTFSVTVAYTFPGLWANELINYPIIIATGWLCFAFDLAYISMLKKALRAEAKQAIAK